MFEEEFDGFGFGFEGETEDGNFYVDSLQEFKFLTEMLPIEEVGISFSDEIKIDDTTSVITDKQVKMKDRDHAIKTYQKVVEMRELTEDERLGVSKARLFLKKTFDVLFRGRKYLVIYGSLCVLLTAGYIASESYLPALIWSASFCVNCSPIKYAKELKKMFGSKKRKEELKEELLEDKVYGSMLSIDNDEGIQLYFRPMQPKNM